MSRFLCLALLLSLFPAPAQAPASTLTGRCVDSKIRAITRLIGKDDDTLDTGVTTLIAEPRTTQWSLDAQSGELRDRYFDNAASGTVKGRKAAALGQGFDTYATQLSRLYTRRNTPQGVVHRLGGYRIRVKDLVIDVPDVSIRSAINPSELEELGREAKIRASHKIQKELSAHPNLTPQERKSWENAVLRTEMEALYFAALQEKLGFHAGRGRGRGLRRSHFVNWNQERDLWRIFKPFYVQDGEIHYETPKGLLKNIQEDLLIEGINSAISRKLGSSSPWIPIGTRIRNPSGDLALNAVFNVEYIQNAKTVKQMLREGNLPPPLADKLRRAKALRDEYDPYVMALRAKIYRTAFLNEDSAGKEFQVGLDPNNGSNYLWDGQNLYVVDH